MIFHMPSKLQIIFNSSEIGAGTCGASLGPQAIVAAARQKKSTLFNTHAPFVLKDWNSLLDQPSAFPYAKRIDGMVKVYKEVASCVELTLKENKFPIVVAADHCSAGGTIRGIQCAFPNKKLGVLWIDAHADLHTPYTTPSGNMHGMPLATALGTDNLSCKRNDIDTNTAVMWHGLKSTALLPENLIYVAVRDTETEEDSLIAEHNIKNYTVAELRSKGLNSILEEIKNRFSSCDMVYISFDVDSMDPLYSSYGTGTPVKDGLTVEEAKTLIMETLRMPQTIAFEMVEVNPCLDDQKNKMAEIALSILEEAISTIEQK